jgi:SAM-dependent methyltransferase
VNDFWNQKTASYHYEVYGRLASLHQDFQDFISDKQINSVLEIGCGVGIYSDLFKELRYTGIDLHENLIAYLKSKNDYHKFHCGDFLEAEFDTKYDLVFCHNTLEHVEDPDGFFKKMLELSNQYVYVACHTGLNMKKDHIIEDKGDYFESKISVPRLRDIAKRCSSQIGTFAYDGKFSPGMILKVFK